MKTQFATMPEVMRLKKSMTVFTLTVYADEKSAYGWDFGVSWELDNYKQAIRTAETIANAVGAKLIDETGVKA